MEYTFLLKRGEFDRIENLVELKIETLIDFSEIAWETLKKGITEWVDTTEEGNALWHGSVGDLNIGDMANYEAFKDSNLLRILEEMGIEKISARSIDFIQVKEFDEVLVNEEDLTDNGETFP